MALNEVSFYNTNGDEVYLSNIVNQMINYYKQKLEVGETAVTDFNEGSEIRNILEAFAIGIYALLEEQHENTRIAFISSSYGNWLDRIGELPFIDLNRIEGTVSTGSVTFTLATAQESDFVIPAGTVVSDSSNGLDFNTLTDVTIDAGETTVSATVECVTIGSDGNVPALNIDTISSDSLDTELVSVSNSEALSGGSDYEEDDDYRQRLLDNVQRDGFGTQGYYVNLCEAVDYVHDVLLVSDASYTRKVLVNGYDKPTQDSVLLDVLTVVSNLDNIVVGHSFTVAKPTYTTVPLTITLSVTEAIPSADLSALLTAYIDGGGFAQGEFEGLKINDSLSKDMVVEALGFFDNVVEVTSVKSSGNEITTISPDTNGVIKLGTLSFTQNTV